MGAGSGPKSVALAVTDLSGHCQVWMVSDVMRHTKNHVRTEYRLCPRLDPESGHHCGFCLLIAVSCWQSVAVLAVDAAERPDGDLCAQSCALNCSRPMPMMKKT